MHDQLYRNQKAWENSGDARTLFATYARNIGLDADRFGRDSNDEQVDKRIVADHERGKSLGVDGTPAFFLNGRKLPPAQTGKDVRTAIDNVLNGKQ
jgi:protein-disulfide isomerase